MFDSLISVLDFFVLSVIQRKLAEFKPNNQNQNSNTIDSHRFSSSYGAVSNFLDVSVLRCVERFIEIRFH